MDRFKNGLVGDSHKMKPIDNFQRSIRANSIVNRITFFHKKNFRGPAAIYNRQRFR